MAIVVYNTMTNKKEELIPVEPGKIKFYLCGPTVYDYFHIGNARPFVLFDVYRRFLEYQGYDVTYVVNITDIDDKIIKRANAEKRTLKEVAGEFTRAYLQDLEQLKVKRPDVLPKATDHIPDMINLIQALLDKKMAYVLDGDVFYSVGKFSDYGQLSGKNIEQLQAGTRIEIDRRKNNPLDFALWKSAKADEPFWQAPWGNGRPGWHIECSVMSVKYLGVSFDIHAGGEDLIFPHHENEIAQSCGTGIPTFARYWMHNGFLNIQGEKMSKSLGNFLITRDILKKYRAEVIRLFFLQKHYRSPINYSLDLLEETEKAWMRLQSFYEKIAQISKTPDRNFKLDSLSDSSRDFYQMVEKKCNSFIAAMEDDFNSAMAVGKLFEIVKESNRLIKKENISTEERQLLGYVKKKLVQFNQFLDLISPIEDKKSGDSDDLKKLLDLLLEIRNELRDNKMWAMADRIRDELAKLQYTIKDSSSNSIIKKK